MAGTRINLYSLPPALSPKDPQIESRNSGENIWLLSVPLPYNQLSFTEFHTVYAADSDAPISKP